MIVKSLKYLKRGGVAVALRAAMSALHGATVRAPARPPVARRRRPARTAGQRVVVEEETRSDVEGYEDVDAVVFVRQQNEEQRYARE